MVLNISLYNIRFLTLMLQLSIFNLKGRFQPKEFELPLNISLTCLLDQGYHPNEMISKVKHFLFLKNEYP